MPSTRPPVRTALSAAACAALLAGCLPQGESGQCMVDADCVGRGQVCDTTNSICEDLTYDATSTESPAESNFTNKIVPFFRGRVCTVTKVRSGSAIPVQMTPCWHPCLTPKEFKFKHYFECVGSSCNAWALNWVIADGAACPADAFGKFDAAMCNWGTAVELSVDTTLDTGPITGSMLMEVPFLTNADAAALLGSGDPTPEEIKAAVFQYPQDPSRLVNDGNPISLLDQYPVPPATCVDGGCTCFDIGF